MLDLLMVLRFHLLNLEGQVPSPYEPRLAGFTIPQSTALDGMLTKTHRLSGREIDGRIAGPT